MSTLTSKSTRLADADPAKLAGVRRTGPIPFNRFSPVGTEMGYIQKVFDVAQLAGDGSFTKKCHRILEESIGVRKALLTTSCTHALEICAILLGIQPGDEIIFPSFTFVSTANAFVLHGATPVFVDIRPDTLNLDASHLRGSITSRTKAIVAVHYAGIGCDMDVILEEASAHGIPVIEDNAHGLFGSYRGRSLGAFGCLATLSFHETKNFSCGEGGALLINDERYIERAEIIREKGTDRTRFFRGEVDKYTWTDVGSSYLPSDLLAAVLYAQLEARDSIQMRRGSIWKRYELGLREWAIAEGVQLPAVPLECDQPYHMFYLLMPSLRSREALIAHLKERQICSAFHYLPLHLSTMGKRFGGREGDFPVSESVSTRLLRLPFFNDLTEAEQTDVIRAVREFQVD